MSIKRALSDFWFEPQPPSELARAGVTAVGLAGAHVAKLSPNASLALGAATLLVGHYVFRRWELKSIGYGILSHGPVMKLIDRSPRMPITLASQPELSETTPAEEEVVTPRVAPERRMLESDYLAEKHNEGFVTGRGDLFRPLPEPTHIALLGGSRVIPIEQYKLEFAGRIQDAIDRGLTDGRRSKIPDLGAPVSQRQPVPPQQQAQPAVLTAPPQSAPPQQFVELPAILPTLTQSPQQPVIRKGSARASGRG
jgi:hypothetical protein